MKRSSRLHFRFGRMLKHIFVPHQKNDYKPHLIRATGLTIIAAVSLSLLVASNSERPVVLGDRTDVSALRLLEATNDERRLLDLPELTIDQRLMDAAALKAKDMLADQYWSHTAPDGTTPWQWFKEANYKYAAAGENLARGFHTADGTLKAWMNSPEHRKNILSEDYTDVGFAVVPGMLDGERTSIIVAMYGSEQLSSTPAVLAASGEGMNLLTRFGVGLQSLPPTMLASVALLTVAAMVALATHAMHPRMPKKLQAKTYRHHGALKATGLIAGIITAVILYSAGQIA